MSWPKRSLAEAEAILCGPRSPHEIETRLVDGRLQRVYKHLAPSLRDFWLSSVKKYHNDTYVVFEGERLTYGQVHEYATKAAGVYYSAYGIRKGDRICICSRNCSEFTINWWACRALFGATTLSHYLHLHPDLLGAVPVLVNAWLPLEPLKYCITHTQCRLLLVDLERAAVLEPVLTAMCSEIGVTGVLVLDASCDAYLRKGMERYHDVVDNFVGHWRNVLDDRYPVIHPEDNAAIMFTSGTTGLPKGVLSTQRQFLTNSLNTVVGNRRAALRRGENLDSTPSGPQKGALIAVPLFHVTGTTSYTMMATMLGMKIVLMRKWIVEEAANLIRRENVCVAGGVPAMVSDLIDSSLAGYRLEGLFFGGSPAPEILTERARQVFPGAQMSQGYGLTETNSISVGNAGEDYVTRPSSTGRACPVNDIMIINEAGVSVPPGQVGEILIRGPNVMKEYWHDPEATSKILTSDGWLKSGDIGSIDEEGFLYVKDRNVIIRGGETISSVSIENAVYTDPRILEVAAVGVPDKRLGELVAVVVSIKAPYRGQVTEASLMSVAQKNLPRYAIPVMIILRDEPFELTPSGKIKKGELRKLARWYWEKRCANIQPTANL
ncbi:uncharacterized protein EV420DRAFT_178439 [Desarmillaria tabescens]|uniref:Uncharacterized protein n=1 Tax=Armillaria tabescens TaxID=1929756 RepID=A0AA39N8P8_ARMTA|nr:uncharacterized protein EV420DRAFT_178439 [Desarmillaria tabescens]KAK0461091.1 hypothetical protein EV420DRAFT_178439 [Desarmillaria tabescens]